MPRVYNFAAGPAMLPLEVLEASAKALVDYKGKGSGIAEFSHRGPEFIEVLNETKARCKTLMNIPDTYDILFLQGGATLQFEMVPMNFLKTKAQYVVSGEWAKKAAAAGKRYGNAEVIASTESINFVELPKGYTADAKADFLHICSNNTIYGTRSSAFPQHPCLIADMSSEIMSRVIDVSQFGLIYAGAQKNLGPAGVVLVILRKELMANGKKDLPGIFSYAKHAEAESCLNTPPTFGIYILLETFKWMEKVGGIAAIEKINEEKAKILYDAIDGSGGYYKGTVTDKPNRSRMNVTYVLPNEDLTTKFIKGATAAGLTALKGYRTVGGIRASIYNAMPLDGVKKLVEFMKDFQAKNKA